MRALLAVLPILLPAGGLAAALLEHGTRDLAPHGWRATGAGAESRPPGVFFQVDAEVASEHSQAKEAGPRDATALMEGEGGAKTDAQQRRSLIRSEQQKRGRRRPERSADSAEEALPPPRFADDAAAPVGASVFAAPEAAASTASGTALAAGDVESGDSVGGMALRGFGFSGPAASCAALGAIVGFLMMLRQAMRRLVGQLGKVQPQPASTECTASATKGCEVAAADSVAIAPSSSRVRVEALQPCAAADVARRFQGKGGYDCAIQIPLSSRCLVRLAMRVKGPLKLIDPLVAPLTRRPCVVWTVTVSEHGLDGVRSPLPVSFASGHVDFRAALAEEPEITVEVAGADAALFDMSEGRFVETRSRGSALKQCRDLDFLAVRESVAASAVVAGAGSVTSEEGPDGEEEGTSFKEDESGAALEFEECALLVGSAITLVGELVRGVNGQLALQPLHGGAPPTTRGAAAADPRVDERVLVSDDPLLFSCDKPKGNDSDCAGA